MERSAQWWATGLENRARLTPEGSTPFLSALDMPLRRDKGIHTSEHDVKLLTGRVDRWLVTTPAKGVRGYSPGFDSQFFR